MAEALFSGTQRRVLGLLFGRPDRSFYTREIFELADVGRGAVQRELARLEQSGLVRVHRVGNQKHFQANPDAAVFEELCSIVRKTSGLADPVREALKPIEGTIDLALIFGSVPRGEATATSDVDLFVVSDHVTLEELYEALAPAEQALGRQINPTLYTREELEKRRGEGHHFVSRILEGDVIQLIGEK
jgi:predicted nucleotidyltransferase